MKYARLGNTGIDVSMLSMGGHEYLANHKSRGFNEDFAKAITPGYIFPGFGGEQRKELIKASYDLGINFYDVTHDSEKEALGRNFRELPPPYPVYIQTRPEGFVYTYDENNRKMADFQTLRAEAIRIVQLMQRDSIDFFNLAFMKSALEHDPEYLQKIAFNVSRLKKEGLVRFACADTFSGESTYLAQIASEAFDVVYVNFNFADHCASTRVLAEANRHGLGVIAREAFMKGALFEMAAEAGITDKSLVSHAALKWIYAHHEVSTIIYGTGKPSHLQDAASVLQDDNLTEEEASIIEQIRKTTLFKAYESQKTQEFLQ
ncbi:MAG: aldo/keto reductase [Sphaerochaeta sp.]|uniref:aldo/keto reductase n=1 Tax=Sphaerochaeta sp. TaxID=1972642 RepID=UPI002FCB7291